MPIVEHCSSIKGKESKKCCLRCSFEMQKQLLYLLVKQEWHCRAALIRHSHCVCWFLIYSFQIASSLATSFISCIIFFVTSNPGSNEFLFNLKKEFGLVCSWKEVSILYDLPRSGCQEMGSFAGVANASYSSSFSFWQWGGPPTLKNSEL